MGKIALKGGTIIDGTGNEPIEDATLNVEDGKIVGIYEKGTRNTGGEQVVETIDVGGKFIMPGLIDVHTHFFGCDAANYNFMEMLVTTPIALKVLKAIRPLQRLLEMGITTVRDSGDGNDFMDVALRDAINLGYIQGPRILASGYHLTIPGGHGYHLPHWIDSPLAIAVRCSGPEDFRRAAREQLARGVDSVKLVATRGVTTMGEPGSAQLTIDEMRAAVEEAHKRNKLAEAHALGAEGIKNAIRAGIDSIAHGTFLDEEGAEMMAERGIPLAPTLSIIHAIVERGLREGDPPFVFGKCKEIVGLWESQFDRIRKRGVKMVLGTDAEVPFNLHGNNAFELELFVRYGMSEMEAIVAGTKHAAEALHIADQVGTLETGKLADLVVLDEDPLKNINVLRRKEKIRMVMKEGKVVASR